MHFYACICAFASDEKLAEEFAFYINLDQSASLVAILTEVTDDQEHDDVSGALQDTEIIIQV